MAIEKTCDVTDSALKKARILVSDVDGGTCEGGDAVESIGSPDSSSRLIGTCATACCE